VARAAGAPKEIDLTWLDWSLLNGISADGRFVLFTETGEGGGRGYSVYIRSLDGSPAIRLGEGTGQSISPDGKRVLALIGPPDSPDIVIYPTGAGEAKKISAPGLSLRGLRWMPDGKRFLSGAREAGHPMRMYLFDAESGAHRPVTPEGYRGGAVTPDGKRLYTLGPDGGTYVSSIDGSAPVPVPGVDPRDLFAGFAPDQRVYIRKGGATDIPARLVLLDPATGKEEPWREIVPADAAGINALQAFRIAPNGAYAYSYFRSLSNLFLVEGVK
jgi:eukaryotic-like serine/threonine-protein kinase